MLQIVMILQYFMLTASKGKVIYNNRGYVEFLYVCLRFWIRWPLHLHLDVFCTSKYFGSIFLVQHFMYCIDHNTFFTRGDIFFFKKIVAEHGFRSFRYTIGCDTSCYYGRTWGMYFFEVCEGTCWGQLLFHLHLMSLY